MTLRITLAISLILTLFLACDGGDPTSIADDCEDLDAPTQTTVDGDTCSGSISTTDTTPTLVWSNVLNESGYAWEVWTEIGCTGTKVASGTTGAITTADVSPTLGTGTYYWRVMATGDASEYCDSDWTCGCPFDVP